MEGYDIKACMQVQETNSMGPRVVEILSKFKSPTIIELDEKMKGEP